jgi:hypothetical protein
MVIWTQLPTIRGQGYYIYSTCVTTERIARDYQSGMPIENTLLFDARGK